jgi:hypothetical protein
MSQQQPGKSVQDLIDLERYPLDQPQSPELAAVIAEAHATLDDQGVCLLPGFIRADAIATLVNEAQSLAPLGFRQDYSDMAYGHLRHCQDDYPADHPVRRTNPFHVAIVPGVDVPADGHLRTIYHWDPLTDFVASLIREPVLYRAADPLLDCNISVLGPGDTHGWHYDGNLFSVTLMLQPAQEDGLFEFSPNISTPDDENFDAVARLYDGDREGLITLPLEPGTLNIFKGRYSLHHVTPVKGNRQRLLVIFSYDKQPDMMFPTATQLKYTGKTA